MDDLNPPLKGHHSHPEPGVAFEKDDEGNKQLIGSAEFSYPDDDSDRGNPLAGFNPDEIGDVFEVFGSLWEEMLKWLYLPKNSRMIGVRVKAMLFVIRPDMLKERTLEEVANKEGITKSTFQDLTAKFRKRFKIVSKSMRTDISCEHMRQAAIRAHAKRRGNK